jgi:virulence plasmid B protein
MDNPRTHQDRTSPSKLRNESSLPSNPRNDSSSPSNPSVASASAAGPADAPGEDENSGNAFAPGTSGPSLPPVALPSGGGAIRGMGENVKVNAVQGTPTVSIPIPASKARRNAAPQLSLNYSPGGGGMGPWGIGWSLAGVPDVTRSTRKGLPTYDNEKDIFVLSGAEDLVPVFKRDDQGNAVRSIGTGLANAANTTYELQEGPQDTFLVREYRPRIDGIYNRIERWTDPLDPEDVHWRAFTPQNDMMVFGRDSNSRIMSGSVNGSGQNRIFSWLCCEVYDCYGNAILYQYKKEDAANVNLSQAHEKNRTVTDRGRQRYLKRVK